MIPGVRYGAPQASSGLEIRGKPRTGQGASMALVRGARRENLFAGIESSGKLF